MATDMQSFYVVHTPSHAGVYQSHMNNEDYYDLVRENKSLQYNIQTVKHQNARLIYITVILVYLLFVMFNSVMYQTVRIAPPSMKFVKENLNKVFNFSNVAKMMTIEVPNMSLLEDSNQKGKQVSIITIGAEDKSETDSIASNDSIEFVKSIKSQTTSDINPAPISDTKSAAIVTPESTK